MSSFSNTDRQRILRESREHLASGINPPNEEIIARARQAPIETPMDRWRRQARESDAAERRAKTELRREESAMRIDSIVNQLRAEFDQKLRIAIEAEHQFMIEIVGQALGEFSNRLIDEARGIIKAQGEKTDLVLTRLELKLERVRSEDRSLAKTFIRAVN
jgi:hypothetical protein